MSRDVRRAMALLTVAFVLAARAYNDRQDRDVAIALGPGRPRFSCLDSVTTTTAERPRNPSQVVRRDWQTVLRETFAKFSENELMSEAASVTFYVLLSLVPALTAVVSIYGLVADPGIIEHQLDGLRGLVPSTGLDIITDQVHRLVESPRSGLSIGAMLGLLTALWSANAATKAMISALNDVYDIAETRSFVRLTAVSLGLSVSGVATILIGVAAIVVLPVVFDFFGLHTVFATAVKIGRLPAIALLLLTSLAILFRYAPDRHPPRWRWVTWGGVFGALAWTALSIGFSWYVTNFGSYNKTYGSLGAIIGFMTWVWLSTTALLVGAQLNAVLEDKSADGPVLGSRSR